MGALEDLKLAQTDVNNAARSLYTVEDRVESAREEAREKAARIIAEGEVEAQALRDAAQALSAEAGRALGSALGHFEDRFVYLLLDHHAAMFRPSDVSDWELFAMPTSWRGWVASVGVFPESHRAYLEFAPGRFENPVRIFVDRIKYCVTHDERNPDKSLERLLTLMSTDPEFAAKACSVLGATVL